MAETKNPSGASARDTSSEAPSSSADEAAPKRIVHYDLRGEIGRGALSVVYDAQNRRTGQNVALKLLTLPDSLTPEEAGSVSARFEREAQALSRLAHPNIVGIREIGVDQGRNFLALERLHGQTLRKRLSAGPLALSEAFSILIQVAGALDAVHEAGLTHRDVKPTNVFLLPSGTAKLLESGIAPTTEENSSQRVILVGSPAYMAPEQIKGEGGTAAADIWALGVLSYEMLVGRLPFTGPSAGGVMHQIVHQPPAAMPHLPQSVQRVLLRVLDKQPGQRPATAGAFVQALRLAYPAQAPAAANPSAPASPAKPAAAEQKPAAAEQKPAAAKPVASPKTDPVPMPVAASAFAAPASRPAPKWLPAAALPFLFLIGFGGAALVRLHASGHAPQQPAQVSAPLPITQASSSDAASQTTLVPVPSRPALPVSPKAQAASPQAQAVVRQVARPNAPALPEPRRDIASLVKPDIAPVKPDIAPDRTPPAVRTAAAPRRLAAPAKQTAPAKQAAPAKQTAAQGRPTLTHSLPTLPVPAASHPAPAQAARLPVPVQAVSPRLPAPSAASPASGPQSASSRVSAQAPAQSAEQTFTLPAAASGYDPEAEARLRKSAWSQSGAATANGEPQK